MSRAPEEFVRRTVRPLAAYGPPRDPAAVPLHLNESPSDLPSELKRELSARLEAMDWSKYPITDGSRLAADLARAYAVPPEVRRSSPHQAMASSFGVTMRMPRRACAPISLRRKPNISSRDADGFSASRCATCATAASSALSSAATPPRMRRTSLSRCSTARASKFAEARATRMRVTIQTPPASKRKSAAMRIAALISGLGVVGSCSLTRQPYFTSPRSSPTSPPTCRPVSSE